MSNKTCYFSASDYEGWHFGGGELHFLLMHCKYGFPIVVKPLLHENMATSGEIINTLPFSGSLSFGHSSISVKINRNNLPGG